MTEQLKPSLRAQAAFKLQLKAFKQCETFDYARKVFLVCREHQIEIPETVLSVITDRFKHDQKKYLIKDSKKLAGRSQKHDTKLIALQSFLESEKQQDAVTLYYKKRKKKIEFHALRKLAERYLQNLFPEFAHWKFSDLLQHYKDALKEEDQYF
jgi:hypothetical protein